MAGGGVTVALMGEAVATGVVVAVAVCVATGVDVAVAVGVVVSVAATVGVAIGVVVTVIVGVGYWYCWDGAAPAPPLKGDKGESGGEGGGPQNSQKGHSLHFSSFCSVCRARRYSTAHGLTFLYADSLPLDLPPIGNRTSAAFALEDSSRGGSRSRPYVYSLVLATGLILV